MLLIGTYLYGLFVFRFKLPEYLSTFTETVSRLLQTHNTYISTILFFQVATFLTELVKYLIYRYF